MDERTRALVGATFIGLGSRGLALPWVWIHVGVAPAVLILAGGLLYVAGAISYHRRWPDPYPSVFGYHEVFHVYVCAAAACQYIAIARFIALTDSAVHRLNRYSEPRQRSATGRRSTTALRPLAALM